MTPSGRPRPPLEPVAMPPGPSALGLLPRLRRALEGGAPLLPYPAHEPPPELRLPPPAALPDGLAVAVATSGTTGPAKRSLLTVEALRASAHATHEILGGPGQWLLALPPHHVAGLQVLLRSLAASTDPVAVEAADGFTAHAFVQAAALLTDERRYTSLVPTQLTRLLADPHATEALAGFHAVLVGGSACPPSLAGRARSAGVALVLTYGMSETCGGCVYDGAALPGVSVHIDNDRHIVLGGPVVASGYLTGAGVVGARDDSGPFSVDPDGQRWFRTEDLGHLDDAGLLTVEGRADDMIITGGVKVPPGMVEDAIVRHVTAVDEAVVVGVDDPEWGQVVCAGLRLADPARRVSARVLREQLRGTIPDAALPRRVLSLPSIPLRGPGKPDRAAIRAAFESGL